MIGSYFAISVIVKDAKNVTYYLNIGGMPGSKNNILRKARLDKIYIKITYSGVSRPWHGVGKVMGSMLGPNRVLAKDVKSCTYCCYVRCATLIV